jgi:hypothetical protein
LAVPPNLDSAEEDSQEWLSYLNRNARNLTVYWRCNARLKTTSGCAKATNSLAFQTIPMKLFSAISH